MVLQRLRTEVMQVKEVKEEKYFVDTSLTLFWRSFPVEESKVLCFHLGG
jgi:hypothetical protein